MVDDYDDGDETVIPIKVTMTWCHGMRDLGDIAIKDIVVLPGAWKSRVRAQGALERKGIHDFMITGEVEIVTERRLIKLKDLLELDRDESLVVEKNMKEKNRRI